MSQTKFFEIFFFVAGALILISLPWLNSAFGAGLWLAGKLSYFAGILFFIFQR